MPRLAGEFFGGPQDYTDTPVAGECFCHLSLHCSHPFTCDVCTAEVKAEFIAWCEADEREDQLREQEFYEISPLAVIEMEDFLNRLDTWRQQPCAPRTERLSA